MVIQRGVSTRYLIGLGSLIRLNDYLRVVCCMHRLISLIGRTFVYQYDILEGLQKAHYGIRGFE